MKLSVEQAFLAASTHANKAGDRAAALAILRYGRAAGVETAEMALKEAYLMRLSGDRQGSIDLLNDAYERTRSPRLLRRLAESAIDEGRLAEARTRVSALQASDAFAERDFGDALEVRLELEERAFAAATPARLRPPLWWFETPFPGNFGDALNPYLIEKLTGVPPKRAKRGSGLLAVGSTIKFARAGVTVWGTGTPRMTDLLDPEARYLAVRGPLTRELVLSSGGRCPPVYGDPALLLPRIYGPQPLERAAFGLVRHHVHRTLDVSMEGGREISVLRGGYSALEQCIDEIAACDRILSTSLHGIIVAHAYGVPAAWCRFDSGPHLPGDETKFHDYFLSVGAPVPTPVDLSALSTLDQRTVSALPFTLPDPPDLAPLLDALREAVPTT